MKNELGKVMHNRGTEAQRNFFFNLSSRVCSIYSNNVSCVEKISRMIDLKIWGKFKRWMKKTETYHAPSLCIFLCLLNDKLFIIWHVLRISVCLLCEPCSFIHGMLVSLNEMMLFPWGYSYCNCPLFIVLRNHIFF